MLYLHGLGHFHPENVITNRFLEELDIGSSEGWILERVGIKTRRTALPLDYIKTTKNKDPRAARGVCLYTNAQTGGRAARLALERARLQPRDIGMVISGSSAPDYVTPAEAATVAAEIGADVPCFDLNSACSTFGMQLKFLSDMRPGILPPYVLIVNPENVTRVIDYSDRKSAPLFGDGASAAVVSASVPSKMVFEAFFCDSNPLSWDKVRVPRVGHFDQDGGAVQGFAIRKTTQLLRELQELYPAGYERFKFVGHQANFGMLKTVCERCGISEEDHWNNVIDYGNAGCSGAPCVLSQHWDDLRGGDYIALALVGAGLTWVRTMLKIVE
ncbi:MAG: 3-oxoacyl-[acyl-carrier-protein] synthase III C-terminal domain-containing protein [Syntrophales bacterium]|nr:3-oxoacyl-[acyl-carrier-protein] synthase III C-terminal domain-containing protein [Syntrophales bacterium]